MPVTPYHFGVGLLLKGAAPARVSILAFMATQIALDLESGYYLLQQAWPFHRELHTLALATPVGLGVGLATWGAGRVVQSFRLRHAAEFGLVPALLAGLAGGVSHVLLDAVTHSDVRPFEPLSRANPLLRLLSITNLEALCLLCALAGATLWVLRDRPRR